MNGSDSTRKAPKLVDVINMLGSVASLTGVSLLWLKGKASLEHLFIEIPAIAVLVSLVLGFASILYYLIRSIFVRHFSGKDPLLKFSFFAFAIPIGFSFLVLFGIFIESFVRLFVRELF
ncbi:hypothetical protein ACN2AK_21760 [Shewanella xiamenensis]|jgi:hypothetical protein|uniref:hypothetical protein n=1 Tax=Shewanella TaxID=22 RepID=UPI0002FB220F|nr:MULTISPECIES: hypothetical protein [Shewanella]MEE1978569.1 hypothetical protein [Shewanella xiamenensis]